MSPLSPTPTLHWRDLWDATTTSSSTTSSCTPFTLPSGGVLSYASSVTTLTSALVFQPQCTDGYTYPGSSDSSTVTGQEPFYASTIPQVYVVAAATVIAWVLVIMLTINPRSFYMGGIRTNVASGRGLIGGATGAGSGPGVGSRPWLQKVAALAVAVSLTIATADTFKVAREQYRQGYSDGAYLRSRVEGSMEIRIVRVISDIFLWLAQVQTLIRLFPRHKEKVIIKWIGFCLIVLDTIFSCLDSFLVDNDYRPRDFVDAIPALNYLFELAVGLLYAAWVMFYGVTKRRYAYYHRRMKNICVVAFLSHMAILVPVVFFITDVAQPDVAAWGDYFRWVGLAAASVIVWEWVERIEALERDEKKDGILGREIFDGDEMLDSTPTEDITYTRKPRDEYRPQRRPGDPAAKKPKISIQGISLRSRFKSPKPFRPHFPLGRTHTNPVDVPVSELQQRTITFEDDPIAGTAIQTPSAGEPTPSPPRIVSPPSRTNTTSAASTVYVVNYGEAPDIPQPVRRRDTDRPAQVEAGHATDKTVTATENEQRGSLAGGRSRWQQLPHPFKRKRMTPPAEVRAATERREAATPSHNLPRWDVAGRLGAFAAERGERFRERKADKKETELDELPWTIIPVRPRGAAAWSPDMLEQGDDGLKEESFLPSQTESSSTARDTGEGASEGRVSDGSRQTITWSETTITSSAHSRNGHGSARSRSSQQSLGHASAGAGSSRSRDRSSNSGSRSSVAGASTVIAGPSRPRQTTPPVTTGDDNNVHEQ